MPLTDPVVATGPILRWSYTENGGKGGYVPFDLDAAIGIIVGGSAVTLAADATAVTSNTLTAQTGLSRPVTGGVTYGFTIILRLADSGGAGVQIDLNGGSAVATWFWTEYRGYDEMGALVFSKVAIALTGIAQPDLGSTFNGIVEIKGWFSVSGSGSFTFIPRIARQGLSGSIQVLQGSTARVE